MQRINLLRSHQKRWVKKSPKVKKKTKKKKTKKKKLTNGACNLSCCLSIVTIDLGKKILRDWSGKAKKREGGTYLGFCYLHSMHFSIFKTLLG
jgi:hypothetical protein